ncbi:MAG: response regulator transcription factor, partial [Chloroflexota bacterium]|nr:response regulator transcription factor [Chloroflexota bacterium]
MIRVMLVDDHASFRQPLAFMLGREADISVVAEAGSLAESRAVLARTDPVGVDVAIVDLHLPDGDGVDIVRDLRTANPHGQVLVLSGETERDHLARAIEAGASGMLHKSARIAEIIDAVRRLCDGESLLSPRETVELFRLVGQQR